MHLGEAHLRRRILVTGGAGFLGSHLCERLLEDGHDVLCVDNYFTGRRENIAHLLDDHNFEAMRHDVTFPLYVEVDEIYNLACPASPIHYQFDPVQTTKTSVHGAINMLGLAKRVKGKILQASTSEVYGDPSEHPQTEAYWGNVNPIGPRSCYDEGKRCAETLFFDYYRQHRLRIRVARIFNTYGPRMQPNDGRVVSNFIVQALKGEADHHLWRRQPDPVVLLRGRPDRRSRALDGGARRGHRSRQHRQSRRIHHASAGGEGRRQDRVELEDRLQAAAGGRSEAAAPGHRAGAEGARLEAPRSSSTKGSTGRSPISRRGSPRRRGAEARIGRRRGAQFIARSPDRRR